MSHRSENWYVEGYVPGDKPEREVQPFNPNSVVVQPIEKPISLSNTGQLRIQKIVALATTSDGNLLSNDTFLMQPLINSAAYITVNGLVVIPANGASQAPTSSCYITDSTGAIIRPQGSFFLNDKIHWNGSIAGYQIETTDLIELIYES